MERAADAVDWIATRRLDARRTVAERLGRVFMDLDREIERREAEAAHQGAK